MKLTTAVQKGLLSIFLILGSLVLLIIALWKFDIGEKYCVYPAQRQVGNAWCFFIDINVNALCCSSMACFISK